MARFIDEGEGVQVGFFRDHALEKQQVLSGVVNRAPEGQLVAAEDKDHALKEQQVDVRCKGDGDFESNEGSVVSSRAKEPGSNVALEEPTFSMQECLGVLQACRGVLPGQERGFDLDGASAVFGLVMRGKAAEVQGGNSELAKYLNGIVSHHGCEAPWTTIGVSLNKLPGWNRLISRDWPSWVCLLGDVKGAGLWVKDDSELGLAVRWVQGLGYCTGRIVDARARAIRLEGGQAYSVEPWTGGDLWMVRAWVAGETGLDWGRLRGPLLGMGFWFSGLCLFGFHWYS